MFYFLAVVPIVLTTLVSPSPQHLRLQLLIGLAIRLQMLSIGSMHRTASLLDLWRHCKYIWLTAVAAAVTIQSLRTVAAVHTRYGGLRATLRHVPPSVIALMTIWPLVIFCVDEAIRHHDRKKVLVRAGLV